MKKGVVFLGPGLEEVEGLTRVDYRRRAGVEVVMTAVGEPFTASGEGPVVLGARKIPVVCSGFFNEQDLSDADMLILPGGMPGTTNLEADATVMAAIAEFDKAGKYVAAPYCLEGAAC